MTDQTIKEDAGGENMIKLIQRFCMWLVMDSCIRLGRLAPWVFGIGMGRMPHRVDELAD